jgi:hypothetical protein
MSMLTVLTRHFSQLPLEKYRLPSAQKFRGQSEVASVAGSIQRMKALLGTGQAVRGWRPQGVGQ